MSATTLLDADSDADLREARRRRVFDAAGQAGLDVVVLSRRDSVAYATGARGLWTAGTRPFGAACVLVPARRSVHLLSTWDEGIPPDVPFENLYGVTWNPMIMAQSLGAIPGLPEARRIGVDALSVGFEKAAARLAPEAILVPVDDLLQQVRTVKLPAEVGRIRAATAVASAAVKAAADALRGGAGQVDALTAGLRAAAAMGVTVPASEPVVAPSDPSGSLFHIDFGFVVDGYEGGRGCTISTAGRRATDDARAAVDEAHVRLVAACEPGATVADLRAAVGDVTSWRVRGTGMGFEPPLITADTADAATLVSGMVLSVEVEAEAAYRRDMAVVGDRFE